MGSVGDEPAALLLGGLQPVRQVVEFRGQHGQLVVAANADLLRIVALLNDVHGVHNGAHPPGKMLGIGQGKGHHRQLQHHGDLGNGFQQQVDDLALGAVVFRHIHAAGDGAAADNGGGSPGDHGGVVIAPGEHIVALAGPQDLGQQGVASQLRPCGVVDAQPCLVRDDEPGGPETLQLAQDPGDGGVVPHLQGGKLVGGQLALLDHGAFLVFVKEPLA